MKNPGWIDIQVNGHHGVDYSNPNLTEESFLRSAEELLATGTERFLPTIITSPLELVRKNGEIIRHAVETHGLSKEIPGIHLEGPFISPAPGAVGAHNPQWTQLPAIETVQRFLDATGGFIRIITFGADTPGVTEAITYLKEKNVVASVGHHLATYAQVHAVADAGAKCLTHLGNGCPNMIDRHANPIWSGLAEERLTALIITDGHHLPGDLVKIMIRCKGIDKVIVTSDATSMTGYPPGNYETLGNPATLTADGKLYNPDKGCLVGSASTISRCMEFLESLDFLTETELKRLGRDNAIELLGL